MAKTKTVQISDEVRDVLKLATINGNSLVLNGQLSRPLYEAVDKVLKAAGGKWSRSKRAHVFPDGTNVAEVFGLAIETGEVVDQKKTLQQFYTPRDVVDLIFANYVSIPTGSRVLEPSAGEGALAIALAQRGCQVVCIEIDPRAAAICESYGYQTTCGDFLKQAPPELSLFDYVLMNPPFAGDQDIDHVLHAIKFVKPGGAVYAIMSPGFLFGKTRKRRDFLELIETFGQYVELPEGSFSESGTNVRTVLVQLNRRS